MFAKRRNKDVLVDPCNRIIMSLIRGRFHPAVGFADLNNLLDFLRSVVAETEPLELAANKGVVDGSTCFLEGDSAIRSMEIHDVDFGDFQGRN